MHNEKGAIFSLMPRKRPNSTAAGSSRPISQGEPVDQEFKADQLNEEEKKEEAEIYADILDDYLVEIPRYITLNQVNVKIAGGTDKLLVIRDVTSIVMNENIMETKREMAKMTDQMVRSIENCAIVTE